ncbi:MAG: hypothetical protein QY326_08485 [Bdellovibrionota bacterium]|nr:MAG: hypothetical protein QY326_08485 [Bdellovibrionota bacterium]
MEITGSVPVAGASSAANAVSVKIQNSAQEQQEVVIATLLAGVQAANDSARRLLAVA